jgi:hypothetical protein
MSLQLRNHYGTAFHNGSKPSTWASSIRIPWARSAGSWEFDDSKMLDQIDAVFVTLEPGGESHKPSGKSLLFAYLKVNSNHP